MNRGQVVGWAVAGVLVALVASTLNAAVLGSQWRTKLVIDEKTLGGGTPIGEWSGKRLALADIDADGDLDLIAHNTNTKAYVIDLRTGRALVEVGTRYPYGPDLGPFNGAVAADLDGDGRMELVIVNRAAVVTVYTIEPQTLTPTFLWDRHLKDLYYRPTADSAPRLADLDADGFLDITTQTEEKGTFALHGNGSLLWRVDHYGGNAEPVPADIDGDGDLDVVVFTDGGVVYAVEGSSGALLWRYDSRRLGLWPGSIVSSGLVDDIDGDGKVEVVACARNVENATPESAPGAPYYRDHHFVLFAVRDGKALWHAKPSWGNPLCSAYLVAHDVDGDGKKEIFGMDWNTIGHKPGNWERLGSAHAFSYTSDGRERWHAALATWDAKPPFAMLDADGVGDQDVVAYDRDSLVALDARTGRVVDRVGLGSGLMVQGPVVADIDGQGSWRVMVALTRPDTIVVYEPPRQTVAPAWPGWEAPARPAFVRPTPITPTPTLPPTLTPTPTPPTPSPSPDPTPVVTTPATPSTTPTATTPENGPTPTPTPTATPSPETVAKVEVPGSGAMLVAFAMTLASLLNRRIHRATRGPRSR